MKSITLLLSLSTLSLAILGQGQVKLALGEVKPTAGNLQTCIDEAANSLYLKTTNITTFTGTSNYPYSDHNPMNTQYTQNGLYMVERKSGYYTYNNAIWHISIDDKGVEKRALSMSTYQTFSAYYKTLKDFSGTYVSGHLVEDTLDTTGYTYKNNASDMSQADLISLIYFCAPLITLDNTTISNYTFAFKFAKSGETYLLSKITFSSDLKVQGDDKVYKLVTEAAFSNIGSTTLAYTI